ncbi:hypothetical protein GCM10009131_04830 [Morganella psychrotolerans]
MAIIFFMSSSAYLTDEKYNRFRLVIGSYPDNIIIFIKIVVLHTYIAISEQKTHNA